MNFYHILVVFSRPAGKNPGCLHDAPSSAAFLVPCERVLCTNHRIPRNPQLRSTGGQPFVLLGRTGVDDNFRNSGVVVLNDTWFGVNGVDAENDAVSYPNSIVQFNMTTSSFTNTWSLENTTGHDVDLEGLSCGPDKCTDSLFVADGYNYIYQLDFDGGELSRQWDLNSIVGEVNKGIEALTYASTTGCFYAGVQDTSTIHVVRLEGATEDASAANVFLRHATGTLGIAILLGLNIAMG